MTVPHPDQNAYGNCMSAHIHVRVHERAAQFGVLVRGWKIWSHLFIASCHHCNLRPLCDLCGAEVSWSRMEVTRNTGAVCIKRLTQICTRVSVFLTKKIVILHDYISLLCCPNNAQCRIHRIGSTVRRTRLQMTSVSRNRDLEVKSLIIFGRPTVKYP